MLGGFVPHRVFLDGSKVLCTIKLTKVLTSEEIKYDENTEIFHWVKEEKWLPPGLFSYIEFLLSVILRSHVRFSEQLQRFLIPLMALGCTYSSVIISVATICLQSCLIGMRSTTGAGNFLGTCKSRWWLRRVTSHNFKQLLARVISLCEITWLFTTLFAARISIRTSLLNNCIFYFPVSMLYDAFTSQRAVKWNFCLFPFCFFLILHVSNIKYAQNTIELLLFSAKAPTE